MSHFSVCVVIPKTYTFRTIDENNIDNAAYQLLAAYEECTDNPEFLEFMDESESASTEYLTKKTQVVRSLDGSLIPTYSHLFYDRFVVCDNVILERFSKEDGGDRETKESKSLTLIPDYPLSSLYSFEQYCEEYCGYRQDSEGRWGYYCNPRATWDWYSIGGRFPGELLVREDTKEALRLPKEQDKKAEHPDGYRWVNGARMKDIAWEKMHELKDTDTRAAYDRLSEAFRMQDDSKLGVLAKITDDGIAGWGNMLYIKGESLDEFMARRGATKDDAHPLNVFAFVDSEGEWHASGDMGWFGMASNEKPERLWHDELKALTEAIDPDDFIVIIDCHI